MSLNRDKINVNLIYSFGCTLNVIKPSVVAFTSGSTTFPVDRPLGAMYVNENSGVNDLKVVQNFRLTVLPFRGENSDCWLRSHVYR